MFNELTERGLIRQTTGADKIRHMLDQDKITFYIGFDPTADSLHVGHLLQLVFAQRLINHGHHAILLIGEATASIGDPTGKTDLRKVLSEQEVEYNSHCIDDQFKSIVQGKFTIANNARFFDLSFMSFLRKVGPHFSVNNMLRADCVKSRLEHGLSFLEFNYMVMQSWDFMILNEEHNCTLQVGGDDQWSNMLGGIELIRKMKGFETYALTLPLLLTSSGQKMGKTEKGTVWLSQTKTSINDFFQFWRGVEDADVRKLLCMLTFVPIVEIDQEIQNSINGAKKRLAFEITNIVHGQEAAVKALADAQALFDNQDTSVLESSKIDDNQSLLGLLMKAGFAKSRTEGRNLINGKGISINGKVIDDVNTIVVSADFGNEIVVRRGKKHFKKFIFI